MKPDNYKDLKWREYPKEKPKETGHYLCLRKLSKRSKYLDYVMEFYSLNEYGQTKMQESFDKYWLESNPRKKVGGPVVYWLPMPGLPITSQSLN